MNPNHSPEGFKARYFPYFMAAFFMVCLSIGCAVSLASATYFAGYADRSDYSTFSLLVLAVLVFIGHFLMVRGRRWAVWIIAFLYCASLITVVSTYSFQPHRGVYMLGLLFPLIGLLLLNSTGHRQMRESLAKLHHERRQKRQHH
ncbi:hypothetical protein D3C81_310280 [compost metagenome]|uniref:Membrane protein n=1 Tax=Pseudomonas wadenswilerensis TaxID=1785161 RepID=A0A380SUQ4_9PSED|nr:MULTISPECIES: hypothetical protein [Pseudomonas]MCE5984522.1 hypothetical protein [Pseudomonas sp. LF19]SUQ61050.1 Membrane protein [Pseudomonas wadenswilerensis]